jgi:hypothetical protein
VIGDRLKVIGDREPKTLHLAPKTLHLKPKNEEEEEEIATGGKGIGTCSIPVLHWLFNLFYFLLLFLFDRFKFK